MLAAGLESGAWVALWVLGLWGSIGVIVQSVVQWQCIVFGRTVLGKVKAVFGFDSFRS